MYYFLLLFGCLNFWILFLPYKINSFHFHLFIISFILLFKIWWRINCIGGNKLWGIFFINKKVFYIIICVISLLLTFMSMKFSLLYWEFRFILLLLVLFNGSKIMIGQLEYKIRMINKMKLFIMLICQNLSKIWRHGVFMFSGLFR